MLPNYQKWPGATALIVCVCIIAGVCIYALHLWAQAGERVLSWPGKVADGIAKVFQAKVSVQNDSFTLDQKDIAELAVVQRRIICTTQYKAGWIGSEAMVIVRGVYTVKAGFDLREGCSFNHEETGKRVHVQLPKAKVRSITTESQSVYHAEQGILKRLGVEDFEKAYAENLEQSRREAADLGMLLDAESRIKDRLSDLLGDAVVEVNQPTLKL